MRESIGTTFMLNFIILFIFLVFAFLAGTLSYYKAYRVNNFIVNALEKYEGYNEYSKAEIRNSLASIGYETSVVIDCPQKRKNSAADYLTSLDGDLSNYIADGQRVDDNTVAGDPSKGAGYCVYLYWNDNSALSAGGGIATTDIYYRYGVLTYMQMKFPIIDGTLKIPIFSSTNRIYYFN